MPLDNTREGVALKLLEYIAWAENRQLDLKRRPSGRLNKDWILKTYAACLQTVSEDKESRRRPAKGSSRRR